MILQLLKIGCARYRMVTPGVEPIGDMIRARLATKNAVCTMTSAANHLIGKKRISLKNAYFEMFKQEIQTGAHGSFDDAMASRRVYYELKNRNGLLPATSLAEREYETPYVAAAG